MTVSTKSEPRMLSPKTALTRRRMLQRLAISAAAAVIGHRAQAVRADGGASDRQTLDAALRSIPLQALSAEARGKIQYVTDETSFYRRLPQQSIDCDPAIFRELVRYPELLIGMWDVMGATKVQVRRVAPYIFQGDDNAGTKCVAELLLGNDAIHIYYATGDYTGKLVQRKIDGASVCVVHHRTSVDPAGSPWVTAYMDVFLRIDNVGADLVVRTLAPLVAGTADQNFVESMEFISQVSRASQENPYGVRTLTQKLRMADAAVKERFAAEVFLTAERHALAQDAATAAAPQPANPRR